MERKLWISLLFLLLTLGVSVSAQNLVVRGMVISADEEETLVGAEIRLKGSTQWTLTDNYGMYELTIRPSFFHTEDPPVLLFSFTGFEAMEVPVNENDRIDVALTPSSIALEEVIVTGAAVGRSAEKTPFSVGKISRELLEIPATNLGANLQGKVAGLRVNSSGGQPGQGDWFQVRSANALANAQHPLLIVDGIYLGTNTFIDINPEDIEKVEILKGSAAASLYGSQAANGVIQVFTRRGNKQAIGETKVIYRGEIGQMKETGRLDLNTLTNRGIIDPEGPQPILGTADPGTFFTEPLPNLQDYQESVVFQNGLRQSNYLAVIGKGSQTSFMASAQRLREEGILQTFDGYTRNALRLNVDHQVSSKFNVKWSSAYSAAQQDFHPLVSNGAGSFLATSLFLTPIFDLEAPNEEDDSLYDWDIDNTSLNLTNPLYDRNNSQHTLDRNRLLGNVTVNYFPDDWLHLSYTATLDRFAQHMDHYLEKGYLSTNIPGAFSSQATASTINSNGGGIHRFDQIDQYYTSRFNITTERKISGFNTALRGSFLYEDYTRQTTDAIGENLVVAGIRSLDNVQDNIRVSSSKEEIVGYSGFLIGDVDYKQKYLFSGLVRREGSSLFGPENRWATYYRLSGAWRITEDTKIKGFQELKLRASIGTAGIRPTFDQRFETFDLVNGVAIKRTLGNSLLRPATSSEMEIGVDAQFLKAFRLEFNYGLITTSDQIVLAPLSGASGFSGQWRNAGAMEGEFYEANLQVDFAKLFKVKTSDFRWDGIITFDKSTQVVTELDVASYLTGPGNEQANLFRVQEGQSFGIMVGEVFATEVEQLATMEGINPADYERNAAGYLVPATTLGTADELPVKIVDAQGKPVTQVIGDANPDFRMGFTNIIQWKGLKLYALLDWKKGGDIYNLTKQWLYRDFRHASQAAYSDIPAGFYGSEGLYNSLVPNNHFVEDGSYLLLREASLSYTFGEDKMTNILGGLFDQLQLSLIGRNLFTSTKYTGFHPAISSVPRELGAPNNRFPDARGSDLRTPNGDPGTFAVDVFNYPLVRTVSFALELQF